MTYTVPTLYLDILGQSHTLIGGQTGSGKSVMLNGILTTACRQGNNLFILIDPKRVELRDYKQMPTVLAYANTSAETARALDKAISIMEERYRELEKQGEKKYNGNPLLVVIDELADLLISADGKRIKTQLQKLTALGRAAAVKCICATQQPSRKMLPAELSLNFTGKVALHCQTAIESRQVINVKGAEELPMYGQCLYLRPQHDLECWEVPMTDEEDRLQAIARCSEINAPKPTTNKVITLFKRFA